MSSTRTYTAIFVVLFVVATMQVVVERVGLLDQMYLTAFALIMVLSFVKAALVAGYFQHLRSEPRSITYLVLTGLVAALALTIAASYSIT